MDSTPYTGFNIIEYIEPTLCFTSDKMTIGESYPLDKLPIAELVKKDQVLVEFSEFDVPKTNSQVKRTVVAGNNVISSEDRLQVFAGVAGYPKLEFCPMQESDEQLLRISVEPLFQLTDDRMAAYLIIKPLLYNYSTISSEDLYQLLTGAGIISGVIYKQLKMTRDAIRAGYSETEKILLAEGKRTEAGTNAYLRFELEIGPIAGELLKDGSIDFRERKIMVPVSAGQVVATKIPATLGSPGVTVMGDRISQQPGLDLEIHTSHDAVYFPENEQVMAACNGVLSVVHDNVIKVCSKQEIPGDIDYSTGNIESRNSVLIHGSVFPGFKVKTDGDLEIRGSVMSTQISSLANIVIKGGIIGNASSVRAFGDVDLLFIEQGQISCDGNCVIRKQCYYSYVASGGNIRCKSNSVIAGGELIAEGSITLGDVGAQGADPVFLAAGVVAERLFHSRRIGQKLKQQKELIIQRLKGYSGAARPKKLRTIQSGFEALKVKHLRINMIPQTGLFSRRLEDKESGIGVETLRQPEGQGCNIGKITIEVHGTIFAGSLLRIGNRTLTVGKNLASVRFLLDKTQQKIITTPLR